MQYASSIINKNYSRKLTHAALSHRLSNGRIFFHTPPEPKVGPFLTLLLLFTLVLLRKFFHKHQKISSDPTYRKFIFMYFDLQIF